MSNSFTINDDNKVQESRLSMMKTQFYYGSLLAQLKLTPTADTPTFSINSKEIRYNPEFACKLSMATIKVIFEHELGHLVFQHHLRGSKIINYNHNDFNIAGDLAINSFLWMKDGFPDDALVPGRDEYSDFPMGLTAEDYYKMICKKKEDEKKEQEQSDENEDDNTSETENDDSQDSEETDSDDNTSETENDDSEDTEGDDKDDETEEDDTDDQASDSEDSEGDSVEDSEGDPEVEGSEESDEGEPTTFGDFEQVDDEDIAEEEKKVRQMTMTALASAQMGGEEVPKGVKDQLDKLMGKPKVPWQKVLRNSMSNFKRPGINWMSPSRRVQGDFIMPSRKLKSPGGILFVGDSSYSMKLEDLHDGLRECQAVLELAGEIELWQFNTRINMKETLTRETKIENIGIGERGGTSFQCVVDEMIKTKYRPKIMVVLTDLEIEKLDWKKELKGIPVVWLCTTDLKATYGKTININN